MRRFADHLGYERNFVIYDTDDQKSVIKEICKRLNIDTKIYKERALLSAISSAKNEMIDAKAYALNVSGDFGKQRIADVYGEYEKVLYKNNAMDFDDLLVKTVEVLRNNEDVLNYYQERFKYIMVDEYQDTNTAQFKLLSLLASRYQNLCVVGDDDQSIYKFRGANIYNILNFEKEFPNAVTIKLEQNYRSTQTIVRAANSLIEKNQWQIRKEVFSEKEKGEAIGVYKALEENSLKEQIIITSPMMRCKQTAEIILPVAQHHKIHTVKEFAEMDFGEWELKSYKELSTDIRFRDSYQAWIDSGGTLAFPNGESRKEFCKRSICGFERVLTQALELKRAMPDKEIQIVFFVHGGTIMAIMSRYCDMDYYDYQVKNGCGYSCEVAVEGNEIVFNEIVPISL